MGEVSKQGFKEVFVPLIHRVYFGQFKLSTDMEKNPEPSLYVHATKNESCSVLSRKRSNGGKCGTTMCCKAFVRFNLQYDKKDCLS